MTLRLGLLTICTAGVLAGALITHNSWLGTLFLLCLAMLIRGEQR